jgi:hypothetical protein
LRFCRLCGRRAKRVKAVEAVLHEHSEITNTSEPLKT